MGGALSPRVLDISGRRFGKLTAISRTNERENGYFVWECVCDCGGETIVSSSKLRRGHTSSCGCASPKAAREARTFVDGCCTDTLFSKKTWSSNTSGCRGVYKKRSKWAAYIDVGKKRYWLGSYEDYDDAVAARKGAEEEWRRRMLGGSSASQPKRR
jgi:hypothetical protein